MTRMRWLLLSLLVGSLVLGCNQSSAPTQQSPAAPAPVARELPAEPQAAAAPPLPAPVEPAPVPAAVEPAESPAEPTGAPAVELVPRAEKEALAARLAARVKANREARCERKVLRHEPIPGPAGEEIVKLTEGDDFEPCLKLVADSSQALQDWLQTPVPEMPSELGRFEELCSPLLELIGKAAAREDGCSPYLFGRRPQPTMLHLLRAGKAVAALSLLALLRGHTEDALLFALDWLRVTQDLGRGEGASLVVGMVATAGGGVALEAMRTALNHPNSMAPEMVERVAAELTELLAAEPAFGAFLPSESYGLVVTAILPDLQEADWLPPELQGVERGDVPPLLEKEKLVAGVAAEEQLAMLWAIIEENGRKVTAACPPDARADRCLAGLRAAATEAASVATDNNSLRALKLATSPKPQEEMRAWIADILRAITTVAWDRHLLRYAKRSFQMAAVRLHAALRARVPAGADLLALLSGAQWQPLLLDPACGQPLRLESPGPGKLIIRPALFAEPLDESYLNISYELSLP